MAWFFRMYPALQLRNIQLFIFGQLISTVGTYVQNAAMMLLVYKCTGSTYEVGKTLLFLTLPSALFSPFGGIVVDSVSTVRVVYICQALSMLQAVVLGMLVMTHHDSLLAINVAAFVLGTINAFDQTSRVTLMRDLVKQDGIMRSMVSLYSTVVAISMMTGPALAGLCISYIGFAPTFFLNAASFIGIIVTTILLKIESGALKHAKPSLWEFPTAIKYVTSHTDIRRLLLLVGLAFCFGNAFRTLLPEVADQWFNKGEAGCGWLMAASGLGGLLGAMVSSRLTHSAHNVRFVIAGNVATGAALMIAPFLPYTFVFFAFAVAGFGLVLIIPTVRTGLRLVPDQRMIGRVAGFEGMIVSVSMGFGNFAIGWLAKLVGTVMTLEINGVILLVIAIWVWSTRKY